MKKYNDKYEKMAKAPVKPLIVSLAVPTIITMLVTAVYNMADSFFVGRIDTTSVASIGIVFSIMTLLQALGLQVYDAATQLRFAVEQFTRIRQDALAELREGYLVAIALEQLAAELCFQARDGAADALRRHEVFLRGGAHRSKRRNVNEIAQVIGLHAEPLPPPAV